MLGRVLNPLLQNHILARVVDLFIAGHIYGRVQAIPTYRVYRLYDKQTACSTN